MHCDSMILFDILKV